MIVMAGGPEWAARTDEVTAELVTTCSAHQADAHEAEEHPRPSGKRKYQWRGGFP
jgi:hypothetical protein